MRLQAHSYQRADSRPGAATLKHTGELGAAGNARYSN